MGAGLLRLDRYAVSLARRRMDAPAPPAGCLGGAALAPRSAGVVLRRGALALNPTLEPGAALFTLLASGIMFV